MREHHAFGLAGGAGSVNDGSELARKDLRSAHAIGGDFRAARRGDQGFVAKAFGGYVVSGVGNDDVFEFREARPACQELLQLGRATNDDNLRARMIENVGHAVGRLVEIDGNGDAAGSGGGKVGGVPFGPIGGEQAYAVARFHTEFNEGHGQARNTTEEFRRRDWVPEVVATEHLCARVGERIDCVEKSRGEGAVGHRSRSLYSNCFGGAIPRGRTTQDFGSTMALVLAGELGCLRWL